jgi:hypothetical protein
VSGSNNNIAPGEIIFAEDILAIDTKATNASSLASAAVPKSGAQMTGPLLLSGPPNSPSGAATKNYVDNIVASYLANLPNSDAGLNPGDLFWNGGFLCKKV